jgi:hypothetical protein
VYVRNVCRQHIEEGHIQQWSKRKGQTMIYKPLLKTKDIATRNVNTNLNLCDKVCLCLTAGRWFSPGTPVSYTNKTDRHDITEILLNTIN